jgi:hypothetical protein
MAESDIRTIVRRRSAHGAKARRKSETSRSSPKFRGERFERHWHLIRLRRRIRKKLTSDCVSLIVSLQSQTQWCWAAVSASVARFYDSTSTWTQCNIVNAELGLTTCCSNGSTASCNTPWYLDRSLTRVGCLDSVVNGVLSFTDIRAAIQNGRPPCARQGWSGGGGHVVAVVCYFAASKSSVSSARRTNGPNVRISDPFSGNVTLPYTTFVSGYQGAGTWTHSYRTRP